MREGMRGGMQEWGSHGGMRGKMRGDEGGLCGREGEGSCRRSLMFTEVAVRCSVLPICSAIDMKRLEKTESCTGSASS